MAKKILAINGSYRRGGVTDQAVEAAAAAARAGGAEVETVTLTDRRIEFCTNCRACTQRPGGERGACPLTDEMGSLLDAAGAADGFIIAAPVNFFNVSAVMRRFMERLTPLAYWPWGAMAPVMRLKAGGKKAVLISSSAAPAPFGRLLTGAMRALKLVAETFGARVAGTLFIGTASMGEKPRLTDRELRLAGGLGRKLLN